MSNIVSSVLMLKCPRCRKGDLFCHKGSYRYKGFFDMPDRCPECGQDFQIETGFYYGAMYASYALTIAITVTVFVILTILGLFSITSFLISDVVAIVLTMPYITRVSRALWIAIVVKYDPNALKHNHEQQA